MTASTYQKHLSPLVTQDFKAALAYGKVKLGENYIFWKKGLSWQYVSMDEIRRVYRRVEAVDTKLGCCNVNFDIQKLVIELQDDTSYELLISEGNPKEAEALYAALQAQRPTLLFGKTKGGNL